LGLPGLGLFGFSDTVDYLVFLRLDCVWQVSFNSHIRPLDTRSGGLDSGLQSAFHLACLAGDQRHVFDDRLAELGFARIGFVWFFGHGDYLVEFPDYFLALI
jgi:hypothetical protein